MDSTCKNTRGDKSGIQSGKGPSIEDLFRKSEIVREKVTAGKLKVVGALYDIETGKVEFLGSHPQQESFFEKPAPKKAKKAK